MSQTLIRDSTTDNYQILSSYHNSQSETERSIVQSLVQSTLNTDQTLQGDVYTSPANDVSWNFVDLSDNYINTSAIFNYPAGTVTENSVIYVDLSNVEASFNIYSTNISSTTCANNTYSFSSLSTSAPYYKSNYVVTQSIIDSCYDDASAVLFQFDKDNENLKIQYAMQSRWNTTTGPYNDLSTVGGDPLAVSQDVSFNTTQAFGQQGTSLDDPLGQAYTCYWANTDVSNGSVKFTAIDASYQLINNNMYVKQRDMTNVSLNLKNDVGIYRVQQGTPNVVTHLNGYDVNITHLLDIPMFNGNGTNPLEPSSNKNDTQSNLIPGQMTYAQFKTLFDDDVLNTINDEWKFSIDISSNVGGYTLQTPHPVMSDLDNSDIKDNLYYMENYVLNRHYVLIYSGNVTISNVSGTQDFVGSTNIDLQQGERLDASGAGVNGEIKLNIMTYNSRTTDVSSVGVSDAVQNVYYENEQTAVSINDEEKTNPNFTVMWQKVAQNTENAVSEDYFTKNNDAILTLYTDRVVDGSYNVGDFDLSFNKDYVNSSLINLWRLELGNNIIVNPQSLYTDETYTISVDAISTLGVLTNITEGLNYNNYRMLLTAKKLEDIDLYDRVTTSGWTISYSNSDTFLKSSTDNAFEVEQNLPKYNSQVIASLDSGNVLGYSYTYSTVEDSNRPGGLVDYVDVSYGVVSPDGFITTSELFKIQQSEITRTYTENNISEIIVPDASYSFNGPIFNKTHWQLIKVVSDSSYNVSFSANYGPFNNVILGINGIQQTDNYYAVKNKGTGSYAPQSALGYVTAPSITDLTKVSETISRSNGNLSINGFFKRSDLKPFKSIIQATYDNTTWETISSSSIDTDTYYGLTNNSDVNNAGNVNTNIEYTPFTSGTNNPLTLSLEKYYIPFTVDVSNTAYTLESFNYAPSELSDNTTIGADTFANNTTYLSVQNNYDVTNEASWSTTNYSPSVTRSGNDVTLTVRNSTGHTVFTITLNDTTVFLGTMIISYIPNDTYRADRLLGPVSNPTFKENFGFTSYTNNNGMIELEGIPGVYITNNTENYSPSNSPVLGSYQSFRVLGDFLNIAYYGATSDPTSSSELGNLSYNEGSLEFQYSSDQLYSAKFTFPYYRGYLGPQKQSYTINRTRTFSNFIIDGSGNSTLIDRLTENMYYTEGFNVNDLRNSSNLTCANLNLTGLFNYSIPPDASDVTYDVNVTGDTMTVDIFNDNYFGDVSNIIVPGATPVIDPKQYFNSMTLKDYGRDNAYTFSGNWHFNNALMGIRPSRVKLTNSKYTGSTLNYYIKFQRPFASLYKAKDSLSDISHNWLGNPALHGSQDADVTPSADEWIFIKELLQQDFYDGFNIGSKTIYQSVNLPPTLIIAYFVSVPPYYKYEQISTNNCPVIPYNYGTDYSANETIRYYPYTGVTNTFNPFYSDVSFTDILGNVTTVENDQEYLNNVTITLQIPATLTDLHLNPDSSRIAAIVPGTNLEINLYSGNYSSTLIGNHTNPIYNGPITSISSTPDINNTSILFRNRDASGGINFSLLQYPVDIGYPSGEIGYREVLRTTNQSEWYNINMLIENSSWFNDNSGVTFFNFSVNGISPTLYTVVDANDPTTQTNYRRVYKYTSANLVDIDLSNTLLSGIETFTMAFNSRYYFDIDVSNVTFGTTGIWNYPTILKNTNIDNTPITWTLDTDFDVSFVYTGWSFGNSTTASNMLVELLGVQDTQQKWTYITLDPFMKYKNQFGLTSGSVAWDGTVTAPLVRTREIKLFSGISNPLLINNTTSIEQYSESTLN